MALAFGPTTRPHRAGGAEAGGRRAGPKSGRVMRRLLEPFALCRADSFGEAAAYCVYRGADKTRRWRDVYHFANRDERHEVISICTRIKTLLAGGAGYGFKRFTSRRETEGAWNVWVVPFRRGGSVEEASFGFIRAKGRYVLGDIA